MKALPKIVALVFAACICICLPALAQDSTGTNPGSGIPALDGLLEKLGIIIPVVLAIYELLARLIPTLKDISLVNSILKALQWIMDTIVPNKIKKTDGSVVTKKA